MYGLLSYSANGRWFNIEKGDSHFPATVFHILAVYPLRAPLDHFEM